MKYIKNGRTLLLVAVVSAGLTLVGCFDKSQPATDGGDDPNKGKDSVQVDPKAKAGEEGAEAPDDEKAEKPEPEKAGDTKK